MNKITPKDQEPKVKEPKMADTIALAVENGLVAKDPTLETDVAELKKVDETADTVKLEVPDGELISRTKILDVIDGTMARYKGKVVLAMEEVRDIIKAITTAVKE